MRQNLHHTPTAPRALLLAAATLALATLAGCAATPDRSAAEAGAAATETLMFEHARSSIHRDGDDLLTAGLGIDGLRQMVPPAFADAEAPTVAELRRRALWSSWRGIADLGPGGGYGTLYGSVAQVPGREFSAYATVPGAKHPHRVLVQLPDAFDAAKRCVVVTASSGSRGIYGSIAVAGAWGLPRGCAVAYTDKGAGSDYFDLDAGLGFGADGRVAGRDAADLAFAPDAPAAAKGVAFKHAHSKDNPEADWGRHVKQAAEFALHALDEALPEEAPFTFDNTRVIAVGISNGGGAVLRAAELEGDWLDAVVAGEPNVYVDAPGARTLYDYTTEAALLMPCALSAVDNLPQPPLLDQVKPLYAARCASLAAEGVLSGADTAAQARQARDLLEAAGWTAEALRAGALSAGFDLWRAVAATYASAYGRYGVGEGPCGFSFAAQGSDFVPRPATAAERAAWWPDASGIPPGSGVGLVDAGIAPPDLTLKGLQCLRGLWTGEGTDADRVRAGIAATRAAPPREGLPVVVVHGLDDGLIPVAFSSAPYVAHARAAGRDVRYWQVRNVQHFDGFLALPDYGARYLPLLPYVYEALERVDAHLDGAALPADAVIDATPRGAAALEASHLVMPR
ncbi:D-(-)-3-hydroxybutyrate oligomer hydrolase [Luteimonas padinae]|uniref:D-(-)-3-hydroxybutyrate oligomer hydrolase n=1 Tax=Luteimonas padinae TaxID=1714359 RepID=A0ABV6SZA5_9GAMM|nr:D-(-)-3-hydroxybutyrate oligomer hydrolase [Luteimonas padinae]GHD66449.1 D-(-)-3-hydroxybutyrate oligomer hydrolase [Luteimonas padinae]